MKQQRRVAIRAFTLAAAFAVLVGFPGWTAEEPPPADDLLQGMRADFLVVQNHLINAKARLKPGGIANTTFDDAPHGASGQPPKKKSPAELCCGPNLLAIDASLRSIGRRIERLNVIYARDGRDEGIQALAVLRLQLGEVVRGVQEFRASPTRQRSRSALAGMIRPFNALRDAVDTLVSCCPVGGAAPAADTSKAGAGSS